MDGISLFTYFPGTSPLHRFDPRLKMAAVIAMSVAVFLTESTGLIVLTILTAAVLIASRYPLLQRNNLRQLRGIFILALLLFIGRALLSRGGAAAGTGDGGTYIIAGIRGAWRLLLFAALGLIFTVTTSTIRIQDGIASVLKPVPFIPEQKVAVMIGLTVTFVPVIFTISREVLEVHKSRGLSGRKRPLRRISAFTSHVLAAVLQYADDISAAMESRGYGNSRTPPGFSPGRQDLILILLIGAGTAAALVADGMAPLF